MRKISGPKMRTIQGITVYIFFVLGGLAGILTVVLRIIMELAWSCIKSTHKGVKMDPSSHPKLSMVRAVHYLFR